MSHFVMVVKFLIFDVMTWNPEGASNHSKWPETGVWSVTRNLQTYQQEDVLDNSIRPGDRVAAEHGERGEKGGGKGRHILAPAHQAEQAGATGPVSGPPKVSACGCGIET